MSNPIISDPEALAAHVAAHHWPMLAFQFSRCDFSQLSACALGGPLSGTGGRIVSVCS